MPRLLVSLTILVAVVACGSVSGLATEQNATNAPFAPREDEMYAVSATLDAAKEEGQLALIVMGANWCHDSKAMAKMMASRDLGGSLADEYQTLLVDLQQVDRAIDVAARLDIHAVTHTPLVLIVDPVSGKTINLHDHYQFRDVAQMDEAELVAYFDEKRAGEDWTPGLPDGQLDNGYGAAMHLIRSYEEEQGERILAGYREVFSYKMGTDEFDEAWRALKPMRYGLGEELPRLRQSALDGFGLEFPTYAAMPWETP